MPVATLAEAATWLDRVGLALLFPKDDLVLPSLWETAGGGDRFSERDPDGSFVRWVEPMGFVWEAKDELVVRGHACGGKHLRGRASLVSPAALPALVALAPAEPELSDVERAVVDVVEGAGPVSTRELPGLAGAERKRVRAAVDRLQRLLVLTNAGLEPESDRWPAHLVDLLRRRHAKTLRRLPDAEGARVTLARLVLGAAEELSAVDLAAALGWRKADAAAALDAAGAHAVTERGITLWLAAGRPGPRGGC